MSTKQKNKKYEIWNLNNDCGHDVESFEHALDLASNLYGLENDTQYFAFYEAKTNRLIKTFSIDTKGRFTVTSHAYKAFNL